MRRRWLAIPVILLVIALVVASYLLMPVGTVPPPGPVLGPAYYVDCALGDDSNNGTRVDLAWRTLDRANDATLQPGERLLLKRGCTWDGTLEVTWSGTAEKPVLVGAYGEGALPRIVNDGTWAYDVRVSGSHVVIEYLNASATPPDVDPGCEGAAVGYVVGFKFHDVASYNVLRYSEASGLYAGVSIDGPPDSAHHNKVLYNHIHDNRMMWPLDPSPDNDAGAFGVLLGGDDNEVAYNVIRGQDACSYDYGRDGSAVEVYGGRRNSIHHNVGIDNNAFTELGNARSEDNVYAYNVARSSLESAAFLVTRGGESSYGPVNGTKAYNNVVYLTGNLSLAVICHGGCGPDILTLKNNVLWSEGRAVYADAPFNEGFNLYWDSGGTPGFSGGFSPAPSSLIEDPLFVSPASSQFRLRSGSPAINAGTIESVTAGFTVDMAGATVPLGGVVDIGAYEFTGS